MLPPAVALSWTMRSDENRILGDKIALALLHTKPMQRLGRIGFLGAIDYIKKGSGRAPYRRRHNRLEHSIGVAKLAESYADLVGMQKQDRNEVVAAALLHDVGHGPLSHTLEPVLKRFLA
jgi:HD superfamily phosphohydrolase